MIFLLASIYNEALYMASGDVMKYLGGDADSFKLRFAEWYGLLTEDETYTLVILLASPFICRERFWFYMLSIQLIHFLKQNVKLYSSGPRPGWVFIGLPEYSCSSHITFANPSGHAARMAGMCMVVLLDVFFPTQWSKSVYPHLNRYSPKNRPVSFALGVLFTISMMVLTWWGKLTEAGHTMD